MKISFIVFYLVFHIENMLRTMYNSPPSRITPKTSHQLFRRIDNVKPTSQESRVSRSSKQTRNFPSLSNYGSARKLETIGKGLDSSKQNLMFESFLQKVNSASKIDQKSIVANYLNSLRKDYDKMHKETKQHMSLINIKKKDIEFMKDRLKAHKAGIQTLEQKIQQKLKQMEGIKEKQQQVQTQRKTLDHIITRMKKDQIFYKQFGRIFEGQLNEKKKVLKSLNQHIILQDQKIHKMWINIDGLNQELDKNNQFRSRKFQDYCEKLQNIHEKELFIQERKERTLELQSIESNDILKAKNMEMRNICLINKVVDSLLETKIQKLIESYSDIQNAFHTIQSKTSISDPTLIASKFFSYEEMNQNLLKSISSYEKLLEEKTKINKQLKQQQKKLEQMTYNNDVKEVKHTVNKKLTPEEIHQMNSKILQYETIVDWIDKQAKRLKILTCQTQEPQSIDYTIKKFAEICIKTKSQTQEIAKTYKQPEKFITPGIRIKKLIKEANMDYRNQKMKQTQQVHEQIQAEDEFLKVARAGVKRNFLIKQKTINMGNLAGIKQAKNENISGRKIRASD